MLRARWDVSNRLFDPGVGILTTVDDDQRSAPLRKLFRLLNVLLICVAFYFTVHWLSEHYPTRKVQKRSAVQVTPVLVMDNGSLKLEDASNSSDSSATAPSAKAMKAEEEVTSTTTEKIKVTSKHEIGIPDHLLDLFAVKELNLVVLDPTLIKCLTNDDCMLLMASPSIQIGTFLHDMKLVKKVFNRKLKGKNWTLKVVNDNTAVLTASHWTGYEKNVILSVLQEGAGKDYFRLAAEASLEIIERAIDKFETSELKGFTVPEDLDRFKLWWDNSHFVECNRTLAESFKKGERIMKEEHVTNFKNFTNMLLESRQIPLLAFGTLLGWYRNCGIIPYTADIDVVIKVAQYNQTFANIHKKMWKYGIHRELAKHEYGLEMTVRIPGTVKDANCDVFYLYPHNSTYEWVSTTYSKSHDWKRLKTLMPTIHDTCTGDIDGHLFFLPCNYMEQIRASYGSKDWLEPQESYTYTGSDKLTFGDGNWNKELDDVAQYF